MSAAAVHEIAKSGFSATTSELYDRARPSYQPIALSHVRKTACNKSSLNIVEIGSGTGIFTRALFAHPEWQNSIAELKAIEPSEGMRDVFCKRIVDPRVSLSNGTFDKTRVPNAWADLIIIAMAYHWCMDHEAALNEFSRILKSDGAVVFVWNISDSSRAAWVSQVFTASSKYDKAGSIAGVRDGRWRAIFSSPAYSKSFQPHEEHTFPYTIPTTIKLVEDFICSASFIANESEGVQKEVKEEVREILERDEGKRWIDKERGIFEYPYKTVVTIIRQWLHTGECTPEVP